MDDEAEKIVLDIPEEEPAEIESPEASEVQLPLENGKTTDNGTRTPSTKSDNGEKSPSVRSPSVKSNGKTPSLKSDNGKTPSIKSDNGRINGNGTEEMTIEEVIEPHEEKSKSQEELRRSEDLSLDGKPTSLEELSRERAQRARAKIYRQCHRRFREIIGKRETKNEELERQQGDLKHRLNMLECSMPAVMVWNIWRMSRGNCVPDLKRAMEKQFQGPAAGEVYCPSTPSRHFDCRVREVEAERKQAQKRVEEARALWTEKTSLLEERSKRLEEVKRIQEETKLKIEQLTVEAERLREAAKVDDDGSCETGECGAVGCKKKWLEKVPSNASIKSADIVCLDKLQELAQNEYCVKRHIADLESREEAYMRTLQRADELWCKLESDAASTVSALQEQLDMKTAANQQMADRIVALEDVIEQLRARLALCTGELEKYMSKSKIDALIGRDDDFAEILDKALRAAPDERDEMVGVDRVEIGDKAVLAEEETMDRDMLAKVDVADADLQIRPDVDDAKLGIHPEDFAYEDERLQEARAYLEKLGFSLSELDRYPDDLVCAPDFACNDLVFTETGLTEEEMQALKEGRVTARTLLEQCGVSVDLELEREAARVERVEREVRTEVYETEETMEARAEAYEIEEARGAVEKAREPETIVEKSLEELEVHEDAVPADDTTSYEDTTDFEDFVEAPEFTETRAYKRAVEEEEVSTMEVATEPSTGFSPEEVVDEDSVVVPRIDMLDWQDDVDTIRSTIAECPDCIVVKKDADDLAAKMAHYTGTEVKEIIDRPSEIPAPPEVPKPEVPIAVEVKPEVAVAVEAKPEVAVAIEAKPEVAEAEVTVAPPVEEKIVEAKIVEPEEVRVEPEKPPEVVEPPSKIVEEPAAVEPVAVPPVEVKEPSALPPAEIPSPTAPPAAVPTPTTPPAEIPPPTVPPAEAPPFIAPPAEVPPPTAPPVVVPPPTIPPVEAPPPTALPAEARPPTVLPTEAGSPTVPPAVVPSPTVPPAEAALPSAPPVETRPPAAPPAEALPPTVPPTEIASPTALPAEALPPTVPPIEVTPPTAPPAEARVPEVAPPTEAPVPGAVPPAEALPAVVGIPEEKPPTEIPKIPGKVEALPPEEVTEEVKPVVPLKVEEPVPEEVKEVVPDVEAPPPPVKEEIAIPVDVEIPVEEIAVPVDGILEEEKVEVDVKVLPEEVPLVEEPPEVPVEELPPEEVPVEVPVEELPPEEVPVEVPVEELPPEEVPVEVPVEELPPEEVPVEVPVEELPPEEVPAEIPVEELPPEEVPVEELPPKEVSLAVPEVPPKVPGVPPEEEEIVIPCLCIPPIPPIKKVEITQTEITRIETVQVVTQTVIDAETQTPPQMTRHVIPTVTTTTKAVDPDSETVARLLAFAKPLREQQPAAMTYTESGRSHVTTSFQMRTSTHAPDPLAAILRALKPEASTTGPEREIRSIYYGKPDRRKPGDSEEAKCNCCQCGKTMPKPPTQPPSVFGIPSKKSSRKFASPSRDPGSRFDCTCAECKLRRLQETLRSRDPLKMRSRKPKKDQECGCVPEPVESQTRPKSKGKKIDQSCTAKIARAKATERKSKRCEDKTREEVDDSVGCACSGTIEIPGKPGKFKRVHCACGDPD